MEPFAAIETVSGCGVSVMNDAIASIPFLLFSFGRKQGRWRNQPAFGCSAAAPVSLIALPSCGSAGTRLAKPIWKSKIDKDPGIAKMRIRLFVVMRSCPILTQRSDGMTSGRPTKFDRVAKWVVIAIMVAVVCLSAFVVVLLLISGG